MTIVCNCVYCIVFYLLKTTSIKTSFRVGSVLLSSATCGGHRHFLFQASVQNLLLSSERYYINYFVDIHKNWTVFISWSCWLFFKIIRSTGIKVQWRSCANIRGPTEFDSPLARAGSTWGDSCIRRIFIAKLSITPKRIYFCCKMLSFQQLTHILGDCRVKEQINDDT